jgi:cobalt/nickel transport system ATP-binding protein
MSHHKIEVADLAYAYPDGTPALRGVSFLARHGESLGVIGANGAGKSTLLLLLMGVMLPTGGTIAVGDVKLTRETVAEVRRRFGLVFQDPDDQLFMPTVREDVAFGPRNMRLAEPEVMERVEEALAATGIAGLGERAPFRLSGGEKKAAAIAGVLAMRPDVLILDEPTASLDPKARRRVIDLVKGFEHTKIIASHDLHMVMEACSRTIVLAGGRVAADGPSDAIIRDRDLMERCGLESPQ